MSNITASKLQKKKRNRFSEAVVFAKDILTDPVKRKLFERKVSLVKCFTTQLFHII
jgi:hypothetical protein